MTWPYLKNIKAIILASLICVFGSSYALAGGYSVGFTGAIADIEASGTETEGGETNSGSADNTVIIPSIFAEFAYSDTLSIGLDFIPLTADVSDDVKQRSDTETSVTGTATATTTSRTQKAQAELKNHLTLYANYNLTDSFFVAKVLDSPLNISKIINIQPAIPITNPNVGDTHSFSPA